MKKIVTSLFAASIIAIALFPESRIAFAHWFGEIPIPNPQTTTSAPVTSPPVTQAATATNWICARLNGQQDGPTHPTQAAARTACGALASQDSVTRRLIERVVTTTTSTTTTTQTASTPRTEIQGGTALQVTGPVAQTLRLSSTGTGTIPPSPFANACEEVIAGFEADGKLDHFGQPFSCPDNPVTTTPVTVDTCAELQTAVALSGRAITIEPGDYDPCDVVISNDDISITCSPHDIVIVGELAMRRTPLAFVHRISWTGCEFDASGESQARWRVTDTLVNDLVYDGAILIDVSSERTALMNSTFDARDTSDVFTVMYANWGSPPLWHEDVLIYNIKAYNSLNNPFRTQQTNRLIAYEIAGIGTNTTAGFRIGENTNDAFVGGPADKRSIIVGFHHLGYWELAPETYAVQNVVWDGVDHYYTQNIPFYHNGGDNTGVVNNWTSHYTSGNGQGSQPNSISPFTVGDGVDNVQLWDGSTLPDFSDYGAQR